MKLTRRALINLTLGATVAPAASRLARADDWPGRPIHVIVPFTAGSASDVLPRLVLDKLAEELHQPIIIDNHPGAGGTIGSALVARAEPDGYTLLATASAHTNIPSLYPNATFDTIRDFAGVVPFGSLPQVLVVSPSRGFNNLRDLVAAARKKKGAISYASAGIGSGSHFAAERLRLSAGFEGVHVPFKGGPEAISEILAGRVDFFFCPLALGIAFIRDGRLKPLAVSSPTRTALLPDVPTTLEEGYANSDYTFWVGMFAPAKTPAAIVNRLNTLTLNILQSPDMKEKLNRLGVDPMPMTPAAFDELVKKEVAANAIVIKAAGIKGGG